MQNIITRIRPDLLASVMLLVVLKAIDGFWTMWAVNNAYVEINPIMAPIAHTWLEPTLTIIPTALFGVLVMWFSRRFPAVTGILNYGVLVSCLFMVWVLGANLREVLI